MAGITHMNSSISSDSTLGNNAKFDLELAELKNERIRLNRELVIVNAKIDNRFESNNPLSKAEKIRIIVFMIIGCALWLSMLFLPEPANAVEQYGVDFGGINWATKCSGIKPVSLGLCKVVHPTSKSILKRSSGFEGIAYSKPSTLDCVYLEKRYTQLLNTTPRKCEHYFKSAFKSLVLYGDAPLFTAEILEINIYLKVLLTPTE